MVEPGPPPGDRDGRDAADDPTDAPPPDATPEPWGSESPSPVPDPGTAGDPSDAADDDAGPLYIVPAVQPPAGEAWPDLAEPQFGGELALERQPEPWSDFAPQPEPGPQPEPRSEFARQVEPEPEPEPEPRPRSWRPGCFSLLLLSVVALAGGGFYAYREGLVTPRLALEAVGFDAAEVQLVNLRDDAVRVDLAPAGQEGVVPASVRLAAFEIRTHRAPRPTLLELTLHGADGAVLGACRLRLEYGDRLQVVALPDTVLIRRTDARPVSGRDLLLDQSSLCA